MKSLVFLASLCTAALGAHAQQTGTPPAEDLVLLSPEERAAVNSQLSQQSAAAARLAPQSDILIRQEGDANTALLTVRKTGADNSSVVVDQGGAGAANNNVSLSLIGSGNVMTIQQQGSQNTYLGDLNATNATLSVSQIGNNNFITQDAALDPGVNMQLSQFNDNNTLNADGYKLPIKVEQFGNANATLREVVPASPR